METISAIKVVTEAACLAFLHALETTGDRDFATKVGLVIISNAFPSPKEGGRKEEGEP